MRYAALIPLSFLLLACAPQHNGSAADFESLVRAERAFANASVSSTTRAAFLRYLGIDAVLFDNGPTDGRALWEARPEAGGVLAWGPEIADVAVAGDMGYTAGPWEWRANPDTAAVGWGHFISVWTKDSNGDWKVAADGGISHGPVTLHSDRRVDRAGDGSDWTEPCAPSDIAAHWSSLSEADSGYSRSVVERGFTSAIEEFVEPTARFFRTGSLPLVGIEAISASEYVTKAEWGEWETWNTTVSASCDLAFSYGVVVLRPDPSGKDRSASASYYRIWRRSANAGWKVVVDVLIPSMAITE